MHTSEQRPYRIRRATRDDLGSILDLLTDYGLPRSYFEPFYLNDTSYQPAHSWVVEQHDRLVSHLRVYDRWIRADHAALHIAGIGNVITAKDARGHGYTGKMMQLLLPSLQEEGYAYSLLWTHLPTLYGRYGWVPIAQEMVHADLRPTPLDSLRIAPFRDRDLAAIMEIYERNNATRTGTAIRTREYWQELPTWLHAGENSLLVARARTMDRIIAYARSRVEQQAIAILELGINDGDPSVGRALLTAASAPRNGKLQGQFPPSLRTLFQPSEVSIEREEGMMGRVLNLSSLVSTLAPLWRERVAQSSEGEPVLHLATSAGRVRVQAESGKIEEEDPGSAGPTLNEQEFAHLLFHGFDEQARNEMGKRADTPLLQALFPPQDFVIWQADTF